MKAYNNVLVIIINYRTSQLMQELIDSITESRVEVSILILDNASTEETYNELLLLKDTRVTILRSEQNLGFTGGINFALNYVLKNAFDFKYFFLLNPDAFSCPDLLSDLAYILSTNQEAACISPQISYPNGDPWYAGARINYVKGKVLNNWSRENNYSDTCHEVDVFSGCAVLFDMQKVIEAGMFSENLFMYFDEAELSIRLKNKGYKILYSPAHKVIHDVSFTTRDISYLKTYYMTRNKFIVFNDTMSLYNKVYFVLHELAFHLKNRRTKNAFFHLKGLYDFMKGRKGALTV